jgi:uncharacterized membrane protein YgaE (UPF0421/DUF939 family)
MEFLLEFFNNLKETLVKKLGLIIALVSIFLISLFFSYRSGENNAKYKVMANAEKIEKKYRKNLYNKRQELFSPNRDKIVELQEQRQKMRQKYTINNHGANINN